MSNKLIEHSEELKKRSKNLINKMDGLVSRLHRYMIDSDKLIKQMEDQKKLTR